MSSDGIEGRYSVRLPLTRVGSKVRVKVKGFGGFDDAMPLVSTNKKKRPFPADKTYVEYMIPYRRDEPFARVLLNMLEDGLINADELLLDLATDEEIEAVEEFIKLSLRATPDGSLGFFNILKVQQAELIRPLSSGEIIHVSFGKRQKANGKQLLLVLLIPIKNFTSFENVEFNDGEVFFYSKASGLYTFTPDVVRDIVIATSFLSKSHRNDLENLIMSADCSFCGGQMFFKHDEESFLSVQWDDSIYQRALREVDIRH